MKYADRLGTFLMVSLFSVVVFLAPVKHAQAIEIECEGVNIAGQTVKKCKIHIILFWGLIDPITQIFLFPESVPIDTAVVPEDTTPVGSGPWTSSFVYSDPNLNPRPLGGIEWTTSGTGLVSPSSPSDPTVEAFFAGDLTGDPFSTTYDVYLYDSSTALYTVYLNVPCPEPSPLPLMGTALAAIALARRTQSRQHG